METKMTGSQKQIDWATDIRSKMQAAIEAAESKVPASHKDFFAACKNAILSIDNANFWIENKDLASFAGFNTLAKKLVDGTLQYRGIEYADVMQLVKDADGKWQVKTSKITI